MKANATKAGAKTEPVFHFRHVVGPGLDGAVIMDSSTGFVDEDLRRRVVQRGVEVGALVLVAAEVEESDGSVGADRLVA